MQSAFAKLWILFGLLALAPRASAQPVPEDFRRITDSLIRKAPKTFQEFNDAMRSYQQDTILMLYLARQSEMSDFPDGLAYAYIQLGGLLQYVSRYDQAIEYHKKGLEAAIHAGNLEFRIQSLIRLGETNLKKESIKASFDSFQEALNIAESIPDPSNAIRAEINKGLTGI